MRTGRNGEGLLANDDFALRAFGSREGFEEAVTCEVSLRDV